MLSISDRIAIVQLCFYVPFLAICILLSIRHGLHTSGSWYYIGILSLMRIVGSALELATISNPTSVGLAIGAQTLQNTGLSPLLLVLVSLTSLALASIPDSLRPRLPNNHVMRGLRVLILVGLILVIVGGVQIGNQIGDDIDNGRTIADYTIPGVTKGGVACLIAGYALTVLFALRLLLLHTSTAHGAILPNEMRLLAAVLVALPFVLVRLMYTAMATFHPSNDNFRQYGGSHDVPHYVIGMCTVMEIVCVLIFEVVGVTLPSPPRGQQSEDSEDNQHSRQTKRSSRRPLASGGNTKYYSARVEDTEMATR